MTKRAYLILITLFIANIFAFGVMAEVSRPPVAEVVFFDVGQGDAALIKTSGGHKILIDGGPGSVVLDKLAQEMPFWDRKIDLVILSHPHSDHMDGLVKVIESYDVGWILWNGAEGDETSFSQWVDTIEGMDTTIAQAGQRIKGKDFYLDILYPFKSIDNVSDLNETSVVVRLVSNQGTFLFTGDSYASNEKELVEMEKSCHDNPSPFCRVMVLDSDVLKVGHHGSKTSSSGEFIEAVSPSVAVISSGRGNSYGHPHKETLERLLSYGIRVLRTDREGDIKIVYER